MSTPLSFQPPFQRDLPSYLLTPLYEAAKPAIAKASVVLATGVEPNKVFGPVPMPMQVEASALSTALILGSLFSSSYATARDLFGKDRAHDWMLTTLMWFSKLQEQRQIDLKISIVERD